MVSSDQSQNLKVVYRCVGEGIEDLYSFKNLNLDIISFLNSTNTMKNETVITVFYVLICSLF
jgi:hypothetical protein